VRFFVNPAASRATYSLAERKVVSLATGQRAREELSRWDDYNVTPLRRFHDAAAEAGLADIFYKDESGRFGLGSFKALGGAYASGLALRRWLNAEHGTLPADHRRWRPEWTAGVTLACATDGNHGRSVAYGARRYGCRCVVYMHEKAPEEKAEAIAALGATVVRTPGSYDDSVRHARAEVSTRTNWILVPDTTNDPDDPTPSEVMQGYVVMALELFEQIEDQPTHLFVQAGVGGLAGALAGAFAERYGARRPTFVVVQPDAAGCLYETARRGELTTVNGSLETAMEMLSCGEASALAWTILRQRTDAFLTIADGLAVSLTERLRREEGDRPGLDIGISGAASFAGLHAALADPHVRSALDLGHKARVLVIGTEGAPRTVKA